MKRLLVLSYYSKRAGSSRYMIHDYLPSLEQAGFEVDVYPLLGDWYLSYTLDSKSPKNKFFHLIAYILGRYFQRLWILIRQRNYDVIVFDADLWPYLPIFFYRIFVHIPYVITFDEAIFSRYRNHPNSVIRWLNSGKIESVIENADHVICWNPIVREHVEKFTGEFTELSLGIDLNRYRTKERTGKSSTSGPIQISWIGTPSGYDYLHELDPVMKQLRDEFNIELRVISSKPFIVDDVPVNNRQWSQAGEVAELLESDIGVMPLPETEWASGKSGCKMLQYMGVGIPAVVSPVGINARIIEHGVNGFIARSSEEWYEVLKRLIEDQALRHEVGKAGREYVEDHNSLLENAKKIVKIIEGTIDNTSP